MAGKCWILVYRKRGTKETFRKAGPYVFPTQSMFGSIKKIRRDHPTMELMFRKIACPRIKSVLRRDLGR